MHLFLEAIDVWLFRDGRPFDARSDHRAASLFPPYPTVMQGVIRSHHLVVKNVDLHDSQQIIATVGTTDDYKALCLRGPFIAKKEGQKIVRYLPVPAHAAPGKEGYVALTPTARQKTVKTSAPTPLLLWSDEEPRKTEFGQWLREDQLRRLLKPGAKSPIVGESEIKLFARESRLGIALNERRTTDEGALYEVEFIRPCKDVGLLVEVEGYEGWPTTGVIRIGGEGRGAHFKEVNAESWPPPLNPLPKRFLLYFATPTYFAKGWQPETWDQFFEGDVKLQAAAVNRFQSMGGFDWAANTHKPARRYVPAGAVYFFQREGQARLKPGLIQNAVTDAGTEIGFGQIFVEEW
ncbi:MAG: type III-B CRISPR module-associated protein Cmr3 [Deltaproteobacteria bacterium]|nr:type III-B CRISPR module-associated protein Cmr3 [Deltaproteobacteria bacterium]